jgi:hypothetical protein
MSPALGGVRAGETCGYGGPQWVHSAANGFSSEPLTGAAARIPAAHRIGRQRAKCAARHAIISYPPADLGTWSTAVDRKRTLVASKNPQIGICSSSCSLARRFCPEISAPRSEPVGAAAVGLWVCAAIRLRRSRQVIPPFHI